MPRYHFNIYGGAVSLDAKGTLLVSAKEARREGLRLAGAVLSIETGDLRNEREWRLEVTDERGMILYRIDVMVSESSAMM